MENRLTSNQRLVTQRGPIRGIAFSDADMGRVRRLVIAVVRPPDPVQETVDLADIRVRAEVGRPEELDARRVTDRLHVDAVAGEAGREDLIISHQRLISIHSSRTLKK